MNANAYGGELARVLEWVNVCGPDGVERRTPDQLGFAYRRSNLLPGEVVSRASFALDEAEPEGVKATLAEMRGKRREAQPSGIKTFGSTFKNPDDPARRGSQRRAASRRGGRPRTERRRRPALREARELRRERRRRDHRRRARADGRRAPPDPRAIRRRAGARGPGARRRRPGPPAGTSRTRRTAPAARERAPDGLFSRFDPGRAPALRAADGGRGGQLDASGGQASGEEGGAEEEGSGEARRAQGAQAGFEAEEASVGQAAERGVTEGARTEGGRDRRGDPGPARRGLSALVSELVVRRRREGVGRGDRRARAGAGRPPRSTAPPGT